MHHRLLPFPMFPYGQVLLPDVVKFRSHVPRLSSPNNLVVLMTTFGLYCLLMD